MRTKSSHLKILSLLQSDPDRPLKYYVSLSAMSRATFFRAKSDLEECGIITVDTKSKTILLDKEKAVSLLREDYPGLCSLFDGDADTDGDSSGQSMTSGRMDPDGPAIELAYDDRR
jgi:hypothetical protein